MSSWLAAVAGDAPKSVVFIIGTLLGGAPNRRLSIFVAVGAGDGLVSCFIASGLPAFPISPAFVGVERGESASKPVATVGTTKEKEVVVVWMPDETEEETATFELPMGVDARELVLAVVLSLLSDDFSPDSSSREMVTNAGVEGVVSLFTVVSFDSSEVSLTVFSVVEVSFEFVWSLIVASSVDPLDGSFLTRELGDGLVSSFIVWAEAVGALSSRSTELVEDISSFDGLELADEFGRLYATSGGRRTEISFPSYAEPGLPLSFTAQGRFSSAGFSSLLTSG